MNWRRGCCVTDCPLTAIQIEQATDKKSMHPILVLAKAYGLEVCQLR